MGLRPGQMDRWEEKSEANYLYRLSMMNNSTLNTHTHRRPVQAADLVTRSVRQGTSPWCWCLGCPLDGVNVNVVVILHLGIGIVGRFHCLDADLLCG